MGLGGWHALDAVDTGLELHLRVHRVHAVQVSREDGRLVAACACANLDDDVLVVVGIAGEQHDLELLLEHGELGLEHLDLLGGELLHLGVRLLLEDLLGLVELFSCREVLTRLLGERLLRALLASEARVLLLVG